MSSSLLAHYLDLKRDTTRKSRNCFSQEGMGIKPARGYTILFEKLCSFMEDKF